MSNMYNFAELPECGKPSGHFNCSRASNTLEYRIYNILSITDSIDFSDDYRCYVYTDDKYLRIDRDEFETVSSRAFIDYKDGYLGMYGREIIITNSEYKTWFTYDDGMVPHKHRNNDMPAVIHISGYCEWWENGTLIRSNKTELTTKSAAK